MFSLIVAGRTVADATEGMIKSVPKSTAETTQMLIKALVVASRDKGSTRRFATATRYDGLTLESTTSPPGGEFKQKMVRPQRLGEKRRERTMGVTLFAVRLERTGAAN
jgi:hypothetical protein